MELLTFLRRQWDRVAAGVALLAGVLAIILGWVGVSGTTHVAAQLPYFISGGLLGLFLLGVGHMLWTSADLRDEWAELNAIRTLLEDQAPAPTPSGSATESARTVAASASLRNGAATTSERNGAAARPSTRRSTAAAGAARASRPKASP